MRCALAVFARRGLGRAAHAEIAKEAGVSVSTVFLYFPTRDELVAAVLDEVARFLTEMAERIHERGGDPRQIVVDHVSAFSDSVDSDPDVARVWLDWSTAVREEVWARYLELQERVVAIVATTIARGQRESSVASSVDPESDARLLVATAHMIALMKFGARPRAEIARFIDTAVTAALGQP
jgi:TetR/AcrR family hemagglutinin/protease transcriptional regulator